MFILQNKKQWQQKNEILRGGVYMLDSFKTGYTLYYLHKVETPAVQIKVTT